MLPRLELYWTAANRANLSCWDLGTSSKRHYDVLGHEESTRDTIAEKARDSLTWTDAHPKGERDNLARFCCQDTAQAAMLITARRRVAPNGAA